MQVISQCMQVLKSQANWEGALAQWVSSESAVKDRHRQGSSESGLDDRRDTKSLAIGKKDSDAGKLDVEEAPAGSRLNLGYPLSPQQVHEDPQESATFHHTDLCSFIRKVGTVVIGPGS